MPEACLVFLIPLVVCSYWSEGEQAEGRCAWACRLRTSKGALIEYRVTWLGLLFGGTSDVSMSWAVGSPQKRLFQSVPWTVRERLVASDLRSRWKVAGSLIICI